MIKENINLKPHTTFMVSANAQYFAEVFSVHDLYDVLKSDEWEEAGQHLILGGGSNMLFSNNYNGFVIKNMIKGVDVSHEDEDSITFRVGAGESWVDFVNDMTDRGYWGVENLTYIPGTVGAAPVQNIGAYGVEVSSLIQSVEAIRLPDGEQVILFNDECQFAYRDSIFKQTGKYIITYVYFKLLKKAHPNVSYGRVQEILDQEGISDPTPADMNRIITGIRQTKLPEVGEIGMAGSFFKNPVITQDLFNVLQSSYPNIPSYENPNGIKIPAGWILETLGYKGYMENGIGHYDKHALVVVHDGTRDGDAVIAHVQKLIEHVKKEMNIDLEPEVQIIKKTQ